MDFYVQRVPPLWSSRGNNGPPFDHQVQRVPPQWSCSCSMFIFGANFKSLS